MKFPISTILAVLASPLLVLGQSRPNPFNIPTTGLNAAAGQSVTLTWDPTTQGTVSLILRNGAASALNTGEPIAQSIPNSGSYTWSVPSSIVRGSDYAIEIVSDANRDQSNFTPQFVIESTNTVPTTRASSGTASSTGTASSSGTASTGSTTGTTGTTSTTASGSTGSTTGTASTSGTSSRNTASTSGAGFQSSASSAVSGQSTGGAPRATAAAGMMGLIALGAMAL